MISVSLMGGLSNQMFQIANVIAYAKDNGFAFGFDLDKSYVPNQGKLSSEYARNVYYNLPRINYMDYPWKVYKEPRWEYDPIPILDNMLFSGYFQSPKYFNHRREDILSYFLNDDVVYGIVNRLYDEYCVELRNSVSVHIRRGDYAKFTKIHPMLGMDYYLEALQRIQKEANIHCILVFSDDIAWCKENFNAMNVRYVEGLTDYESLYLMSLCDHHIIANSSFSWWGAYLNQKVNKIVYAPKQWFGERIDHGWQDIYLPDMKLI
jgi:hypothetical protein